MTFDDAQMKIISRNRVPDYYVYSFNYFLNWSGFAGKRVMEVGGSALPMELIESLGVTQWLSVDIINHAAGAYQQEENAEHYRTTPTFPISLAERALGAGKYVILDGDISLLPTAMDDCIDIIISVNAFEHILDFPGALARMKSALKRGGHLMATFGPIWSCQSGSHFWARSDWHFDLPGPVPTHAHLLMRPPELHEHLLNSGVSVHETNQVVRQIYHNESVNRLAFDDYDRYFKLANFSESSLISHYKQSVDPAVLASLRERFPQLTDFETYCAAFHGTKP